MKEIMFGQYLAQLREDKKMSQRRLAEAAGLINSTISRIESGAVKPDPTTIEKIASALGVDKTLLFVKCGYNDAIPEEFVVIARKAGELTDEKRKQAYRIFNDTIDQFLSDVDDDEEE